MVDSLKVEVELSGAEKVKQDLERIGTAGEQAFASIATAAAELSAALAAGIAVAIVGIAKKLSDFATAAEETEKALTQLQNVSGQTFNNLSSLASVFARGGTELKKFASEFGNLSEKIASAGEEAAKQDAIKKQSEDAAKGLKATELGAITLNERVKVLLETLSSAAPEQQWLKLADIFKNLGNTVERARIGQALGLSPESIQTLSQGSEAIKKLQVEAEQLGLTLTSSNQQALQQMTQAWNEFTSLLSQLFQKIGSIAAPAFTAILDGLRPVLQGIVSDFENLPLEQAIANLGNRLTPAFEALLQVLTPILSAIGTAIGNALVDAVVASVSQGIQNIKNKWGGGPPAPGSPGFIGPTQPGFAGGGLLGGFGTGTSDSNLAWVSRGEYITPARAVAQPGVLGFLEALRHSGGNLSRVLDGMGRFALGGMVPRAMPAFAAGGLAGGMSSVTIQFPGLPAIGGLRASADVVDQLHRAAALAQVRSGGRKPSRYS